MFNEIATSRRFRGWKFGANIGFWPRESFALNFRCGVLSGLFESSGDNNAYTANDKTQHYLPGLVLLLRGIRRIGGCRCGQSKCRIKNRQEFSGPSATIITGHVQFDGRPVSTLSAGLQRELGSVICVECHRSLSDVLFIHGERGAGGQLVVDGLHYLLQTGRIHTIVVRRSLGGNILNWRHCLRRRHRLFGRRNELGGRIITARSRWLIAAGGEGCRLLTIICHDFLLPLSLPATSPARKRRDMRA